MGTGQGRLAAVVGGVGPHGAGRRASTRHLAPADRQIDTIDPGHCAGLRGHARVRVPGARRRRARGVDDGRRSVAGSRNPLGGRRAAAARDPRSTTPGRGALVGEPTVIDSSWCLSSHDLGRGDAEISCRDGQLLLGKPHSAARRASAEPFWRDRGVRSTGQRNLRSDPLLM